MSNAPKMGHTLMMRFAKNLRDKTNPAFPGNNKILIKMSNENVLNMPTEKAFSLNKVKMIKDGGLDIHFEVSEVVGSESYVNKYHITSAKDIHPDLRDLFYNLRPIMGRVFNITSFLSMVESKEFKATKSQTDASRNFAQECLQNIEVRGLALSGQDDNVGVVLTGLYTVANNQKTAINSPRIKLSASSFGFEEELESIIGDIEREVYAFLFKGKKAEMEIFGADGEPTDLISETFPDVDDPADDMDDM